MCLSPRSSQTVHAAPWSSWSNRPWWYAITASWSSILQVSDSSLNLCFNWPVLIDLQRFERCVGWFCVCYLIWQRSAEQLPKCSAHLVHCSSWLVSTSAVGSDRSVCDLCNTFLCSSDEIKFFQIILACCFLCLSCEVIQEVPSVFSDTLYL